MSIRNIIFDLGNVIIDIDIPRTNEALKLLLGDNYYRLMGGDPFFFQYEKGLMTSYEFISKLRKLNPTLKSEVIIDAWNAMLLETPHHRLNLLSKLKKEYRVFILSNTNDLHLNWVKKDLKLNNGVQDFDEQFFHQAFYSHEMNCRKPDAEIYQKVLDSTGIIAGETLFIDDNFDNIVGARQLGIIGHHHDYIAEDVQEVIERLL